MSSNSSKNKELSGLEAFLDDELGHFENSNAWNLLHYIYQELDELVTEYKDRIDDLEADKQLLEQKVDELEDKLA